MNFIKNVGGMDRKLRLTVGPLLAIFGILAMIAFPFNLIVEILMIVVGVVFIVTGYINYCPINSALGVNTYKGTEDSTK